MRTLKPETRAMKYAQPVENKLSVFEKLFSTTGMLISNSEEPLKPLLVLSFPESVGVDIYNTIKEKPVEYYIRAINRQFGKGVVPQEVIEYAYNQCKLTENGRLSLHLDFSEDSIMKKYQNRKDIPLIDSIVLKDHEFWSELHCAFFQLFSMRVKKTIGFCGLIQYFKDNEKISFDEFKDILKQNQFI